MIYDDLMLFFLGYEKCCENFASKNSKPKKEKKEKKGGLFITQQLLNQIAQLGASGTKSFMACLDGGGKEGEWRGVE